MSDAPLHTASRTRESVLQAAASLFYREGVRAVGMDLIVERSGVAKTTIYRHFPSKDALVAAFLQREDREFWARWDEVVATAGGSRLETLMALCAWVGARVSHDNYRGCPQINVAAEFADPAHPARAVARRHKGEMVRRLGAICDKIVPPPSNVAAFQIGLLFDGAFTSDGRLRDVDAAVVLEDGVRKLLVPVPSRTP